MYYRPLVQPWPLRTRDLPLRVTFQSEDSEAPLPDWLSGAVLLGDGDVLLADDSGYPPAVPSVQLFLIGEY